MTNSDPVPESNKPEKRGRAENTDMNDWNFDRKVKWLRLIASALPILLGALANAAATAAAPLPARPNIIVVMTDDHGYGELACHGNPIIKTPNLDRMHRESLRFTDFHVSPTCSPTRCSLMTGKHEFRSGVTHTILERERMSLKSVTIAQVLQAAGYATGIFGKWHLGDEAAYQPGRRGFDEVFIHGCGGIGQSYAGSCGDAPGNTYFDPAILHNGTFEKTQGFCTDVFFTQAARWLDRRPSVIGQTIFRLYHPQRAALSIRLSGEIFADVRGSRVESGRGRILRHDFEYR